MLEYLKKFNELPAALKQKVSGEKAMAAIEALEKKYNLPLAALIMKIMVRDVASKDLAGYLLKENLPRERAESLAEELKEKVFYSLGDYLSAPNQMAAGPALKARPKNKGANFFFSADDEAEIRELAQKIGTAENPVVPAAAVEDKLKEIIDRAQINFGSAELAERFSQILKTYLRGIRNRLEAKTTLIKPFANGGLSFDEDSSEKVMVFADNVLNAGKGAPLKPLPKIKLPEPASPVGAPAMKREIARDAAYDFSRFAKGDDKIKNDLKKLDTGHELAPPPAAAPKTERKTAELSSPKPTPAPVKPKIETPPLAAAGQMPLIKRRFEAENLNQSPKVKVEDVKYVPKVMGPIDEIRYMDLVNFRRLDKDPTRSADKIRNKIALLEEESYGKKFEGIKSWRSSPLNKLYLEIGHLSIGENKPVDVIIEERKMKGEDYLTADEFKVIMDLNKSFRF